MIGGVLAGEPPICGGNDWGCARRNPQYVVVMIGGVLGGEPLHPVTILAIKHA